MLVQCVDKDVVDFCNDCSHSLPYEYHDTCNHLDYCCALKHQLKHQLKQYQRCQPIKDTAISWMEEKI